MTDSHEWCCNNGKRHEVSCETTRLALLNDVYDNDNHNDGDDWAGNNYSRDNEDDLQKCKAGIYSVSLHRYSKSETHLSNGATSTFL